MVQIWRLGNNFCAFETLSKMAHLKKKFALMNKRQSFCYPTIHSTIHQHPQISNISAIFQNNDSFQLFIEFFTPTI
jgi:hypothetical protein